MNFLHNNMFVIDLIGTNEFFMLWLLVCYDQISVLVFLFVRCILAVIFPTALMSDCCGRIKSCVLHVYT